MPAQQTKRDGIDDIHHRDGSNAELLRQEHADEKKGDESASHKADFVEKQAQDAEILDRVQVSDVSRPTQTDLTAQVDNGVDNVCEAASSSTSINSENLVHEGVNTVNVESDSLEPQTELQAGDIGSEESQIVFAYLSAGSPKSGAEIVKSLSPAITISLSSGLGSIGLEMEDDFEVSFGSFCVKRGSRGTDGSNGRDTDKVHAPSPPFTCIFHETSRR